MEQAGTASAHQTPPQQPSPSLLDPVCAGLGLLQQTLWSCKSPGCTHAATRAWVHLWDTEVLGKGAAAGSWLQSVSWGAEGSAIKAVVMLRQPQAL